MSTLREQTRVSAEYIASRVGDNFVRPKAAIICGSGLGSLADIINDVIEIPYADIPHFRLSTVSGHASKLVYGNVQGVPILAMMGRFHLYEGYSIKETVYPIRVFQTLGIEILVATNAAGGLNSLYEVGDIVVIADHINLPGLCGHNPLMGRNEADFGERFTALSDAYDLKLRQDIYSIASRSQLPRQIHEGVYCFVSGPTYESRAECRMLKQAFGADLVGMSTVPEVVTARHSGMRVLALSIVTNKCVTNQVPNGQITGSSQEGMTKGMANHAEVVDVGKMAASDMRTLVAEMIKSL